MILLKKIRQKLMRESRFSKYLLYAIGEILLVVIGILIAVYIDSERKESIRAKQEQKILQQVSSDLESNAEELDQLLSKLNMIESVADSVLKSIREKKKTKGFFAQVSIIHSRFFFTVASAGYTQLQGSQGVVVQNDALRYGLVELYENYFSQLARRREKIIDNLDNQLNPLTNERFLIKDQLSFKITNFDDNSFDIYEPIDFDELVEDIVYSNAIINQKRLIVIQIKQLEETIDKLNSIKKLLD